MRENKSTRYMNFKELREYYKNNTTIAERMDKSYELMKSHGMTDEEIDESYAVALQL